MMTETTPERQPVWRRLALSPALWGVALLCGAAVLARVVSNLDVVQFILVLLGGWCLGVAFVNYTYRMRRNAFILHLSGAMVSAAIVVVAAERGDWLIALFPRPVVVMLGFAAIPAATWIWIGLLGRVIAMITRRERRKPSVRVAPVWEQDDRGDGSFVRFRAIPLRMKDVVLSVAGIVLVVSVGGFALMILFDGVIERLGPRLSIVIMGLVVGLAYIVLMSALRRRTEECRVAFGNDEMRIDIGALSHVIPFSRLEYLRWKARTDYARIEVRASDINLSVFVGLAKAPEAVAAELPELPRRVFRRLESSGLTLEKSRQGEVVTFRRTG